MESSDIMNLEICLNEYLLAWQLLYGASLSKEIDKFRKSLWSKYKIEYNFCYKDKNEIMKYGKDFIPDNDVLYNEIFKSELYLSLKKEVNKYKMQLIRLFNNEFKKINKNLKDILKLNLKNSYPVYVIHPRMECIEYNSTCKAIIMGSEKDKYDALIMMLIVFVKGLIDKELDQKEIVDSIVELVVLDEIGKNIDIKNNIIIEDKSLKLIKRQIYPFWLMYLGYDDKERILNRMLEDKIAFDIENYPIDKNMKKMDINDFVKFCIKNSKHILKFGNVLAIEKEDEIEII